MGTESVESILKFLEDGGQLIKFSSSRENVLVLGTTGAGKTTLTHFLALNNDMMVSVAKGRGDYVIKDNTKQICDSTINSCTVIPELVIDQRANNTAFYDCPGFSDTRSAAHDIGSTYFTEKVIQRTSRIKFIIAVSYDSVRQGGDRQGFMDLAKHIFSMIKAIDKFENSACLVVTKVDNIMEEVGDDAYRLVPDDVMIENIVAFLQQTKDDLETKLKQNPTLNDQLFYKNTISLINIFLDKKGTNAPKIGIFRRPNKAGPISKIKVLQRGKQTIQKMIYQQLVYTECNKNDFGYTISDKSKLYLGALDEGIKVRISQSVSKIGEQIKNNYSKQEETSVNIEALTSSIQNAYNALSNLTSTEYIKALDFVNRMVGVVDELRLEISAENVEQIVTSSDYLEFIESLADQPATKLIAWGSSLSDAVSYTRESGKWYSFLVDLRITLSGYAIQQDTERYTDVKNKLLDGIVKHDMESIIANLKQFLLVVNENSGRDYDTPEMNNVNKSKLRFLMELVNSCFNIINVQATDNTLMVKGNFVKMKDIVMSPGYSESDKVVVFALAKVFLDKDFRKPHGQLTILAPEFEVMNELNVNIDGDEGPHPDSGTRSPGTHGLPGKPGGPGGGSAWIGKVCRNCDKVVISALGGKGGHGQDGEVGRKGENGITPSTSSFKCEDHTGGIPKPREHGWERTDNNDGIQFNCNWKGKNQFCTAGRPGKQGGPGGDGGAGGLGGNTGIVHKIFSKYQGSTHGPQTVVGKGGIGEGGHGGPGGNGGTHSDNLVLNYEGLYWSWKVLGDLGGNCNIQSSEKVNEEAQRGPSGADNKITAGRLSPTDSITVNPTVTINQYKDYLRQNLMNPIFNSKIDEFLNFTEVDVDVNKFYDSKGFVNDLLIMESRFYSGESEAVQIRSYKNFLKSITDYAKQPKSEEENYYKLVLGYLYTSALSTMCRIKENSNIEVVIDIKRHLKLVSEDIKTLVDFDVTVNRNKDKSVFQGKIMAKINEANNLINTTISQDIDNTIQELSNDMQGLLNETISREEQAETEKQDLIKKREQLKSQMGWSIGLGILQGVGTVLGFLGPIGGMIGSAIGSANTIAQDIMVDGNPAGDAVISKLPEGVNKLLGKMKDEFKKKQELYKRQLSNADKMLKQVESDSTIITDIIKQINKTKAELDEITEKAVGGDHAAIEKSFSAKKDLITALQKSMEQLEKQNERPDVKSKMDRCINVVSKIQNIISVAEIGVDIYKTVTSAKNKIHTLDEAIKQKENDIEQLKAYEQGIYSTMLPMVNGIKDDIDNAVTKSAGKSHAALDVSSWKVQTTIIKVKNQLKQMTNGFDTQNEILNTVDEVIYALTVVTQVYDRIQDYYDQAQLADYISDITSPQANSMLESQVKDSKLREDISKLKLGMQTNTVLAEYDKTMSAVRQYVFPFGSSLAPYDLPDSMRVANTTVQITNVVDEIVTVLHKLENDVTVIYSRDANIFPKQKFNSLDHENPPFYVWKYSNNKNLIAKLLRGEEVMLNADIARGIQVNAVKFDRIGIYFKVHCKQWQAVLDDVLQGFSIEMTLMGNSYYRCANKFFLMTHGHIEIQHSVNKKDEEYFNQNQVYDKIKGNDPLLSPYGMWKMKLIGKNFDELAEYVGHGVDIELEGRASYLNHEEDEICTNDLNKYYHDVSDSSINVNSNVNRAVDNDDVEECEKEPSQNTMARIWKSLKDTSSRIIKQPVRKMANILSSGPVLSNGQNRPNISNTMYQAYDHPPQISSTSKNTSTIQSVNYNLMDFQGNLLLMDMLVRSKNRKHETRKQKIKYADEEYAHKIAYSAYAP